MDVRTVVFLMIFEPVCNDNIIPSILFFYSYLADQCWNGGCIYLIMLRRVKRKAPPPPCNVNVSVSTLVSSDSCEDQQQGRAASEPSDSWVNCKRTRKFGVISRSSFNRDNRDSTDSELQSCFNSSIPTDAGDAGDSGCILSTHTATEESPDTFPQVRTVPHSLHSGSTATLPARCHSQLLECKMDSFSTELSSQVRLTAEPQGSNLMHNCEGSYYSLSYLHLYSEDKGFYLELRQMI